MKHEFYYKEDFPLELRITMENIADLEAIHSIMFALGRNISDGVKTYGDWIGGQIHNNVSLATVNNGKAMLDPVYKPKLQVDSRNLFNDIHEVMVEQRTKQLEQLAGKNES